MSSSPRLTGYTLRPSETSTTVSVTLNSCGTGIKKLSINDSVKSAGSANSGGESTDPLESDFSGEEEEEEEEEDERDLEDDEEDKEDEEEDEDEEEEEEDSVRQDRRKPESVRLRLAVGEKGKADTTQRKQHVNEDDEDEEEEEEEENSDSEKALRHSSPRNTRKQASTSSADGDDDDQDERNRAVTKQQQQHRQNGPGNRQQPRSPAVDADDADDNRCGGDSDDDGGDLSDKNNNIGAAVRRKQPEDYALDDFQILKTIAPKAQGSNDPMRQRSSIWVSKDITLVKKIRNKMILWEHHFKMLLTDDDLASGCSRPSPSINASVNRPHGRIDENQSDMAETTPPAPEVPDGECHNSSTGTKRYSLEADML
uniref:Uncharacterized protein n=1 Tax=Anopheles culicifacies TaxID=139723 RepID=A0A182LUA4_9DIPT